ncbi:hypothetical protein DFJ74DRAFT_683825 [Hyaloraphidium curvatum]|nr:hypothetical protein DFJ74DRAFT_683825 [Hyaloraphidium curvatum]
MARGRTVDAPAGRRRCRQTKGEEDGPRTDTGPLLAAKGCSFVRGRRRHRSAGGIPCLSWAECRAGRAVLDLWPAAGHRIHHDSGQDLARRGSTPASRRLPPGQHVRGARRRPGGKFDCLCRAAGLVSRPPYVNSVVLLAPSLTTYPGMSNRLPAFGATRNPHGGARGGHYQLLHRLRWGRGASERTVAGLPHLESLSYIDSEVLCGCSSFVS